MDYITVGEILKPQGVRGAIKARTLTDDPKRFDKLKLVYIGGKAYPVEAVSYNGDFVILSLGGVTSRDAAEALRGKLIQIDRVNAIDPGDGYLICDIIGCALLTEHGEPLGEIVDVEQFGAADVIVAVCDGKTFRFPFLNRIVHHVDPSVKKFSVIQKLWQEVTVYED